LEILSEQRTQAPTVEEFFEKIGAKIPKLDEDTSANTKIKLAAARRLLFAMSSYQE
jgi:hypothetical protein